MYNVILEIIIIISRMITAMWVSFFHDVFKLIYITWLCTFWYMTTANLHIVMSMLKQYNVLHRPTAKSAPYSYCKNIFD